MAPVIALSLLCLSSVENFGNVTIANRLPAYCTQHLGAPPWPVSSLPAAAAPPEPAQAVERPKAKPKKTVKKQPKRKRCKPGRTRNAAGICGRWR
jgi:hypothetical protein